MDKIHAPLNLELTLAALGSGQLLLDRSQPFEDLRSGLVDLGERLLVARAYTEMSLRKLEIGTIGQGAHEIIYPASVAVPLRFIALCTEWILKNTY